MNKEFTVQTKEGTMKGKAGDWLMTGIGGEQYPCNHDIFMKTYIPDDLDTEKEWRPIYNKWLLEKAEERGE